MLALFPSGMVTRAGVTSLELGRLGSQGCSILGLRESPGCLVTFPPPASLLRIAPPTDDITFRRAVLQELGYVQGMKGKGEDVVKHRNP